MRNRRGRGSGAGLRPSDSSGRGGWRLLLPPGIRRPQVFHQGVRGYLARVRQFRPRCRRIFPPGHSGGKFVSAEPSPEVWRGRTSAPATLRAPPSEAGRFGRNFAFAAVGQLVAQVLTFVLSISLARRFDPSIYGIFVFGFAFPSWFLLLVSLGLDEAISTNVAADRSRARRYLTTVALLRLLLVAIALVALWVATQIVLADPLARSVTMLLGSASVISSYANTFNSIFRAFERFEYPALVTIVERSVTVGISLRLLSLGRSLLEVCVVFLIGSLITLALSGAIATRKFARALQRIQKLALIAGVPLALGGWFYADAIIALFYGTAFLPAADSFRILVFSFCVDTAMMGNAPALAAIGKMKLVLYIGCVAAASTIALSLLLIPPFGAVGAAYAFFVSHLLAAGLGAVAVRRLISPLGTSRMMVKSAFAGFVMLFVLVALPRLPLLLGVATGAAVYFAVLFAIRGASKEDRALVGEALRGALPIAVVRRFIGMVRGALMR